MYEERKFGTLVFRLNLCILTVDIWDVQCSNVYNTVCKERKAKKDLMPIRAKGQQKSSNDRKIETMPKIPS
jgi:hypothetical protein